MKHAILPAAVACALLISSCNENTTTTSSETTAATDSSSNATPTSNTNAVNIDGIVNGYLQLKNALADDKTGDAAAGGRAIIDAVKTIDQSALTADQKSVTDNLSTHAERVNSLSGDIDRQRMHFEAMGRGLESLVKSFGSSKTLYRDFCPMAFDGKGANWVSETEEIRNPYFGAKMLKCGEVKETFAAANTN